MPDEDRSESARRAAEAAGLLVRLADERPALLHSLIALLEALLVVPERPAANPTPTAADEPSPSAPALDPTPPSSAVIETIPIAPPPPAALVADPIGRADASASAAEENARARLGMQALFLRFDDPSRPGPRAGPGRAVGGLAPAPIAPTRELPTALWSEDAREARDLAALAGTQARRARTIRRTRHSGSTTPPGNDLLARREVDDWMADVSLAAGLEPADLREVERWYRVAMMAALELADWFDSHPKTALGAGPAPKALADRLQCLASAQKGLYTWFDDHVARSLPPGSNCCGVQWRIYRTLADSWTKRFRAKLDHMRRDERLESAHRARIERALCAFETESLPHETEPPPEGPRAKPACSERFDSVSEAFEAAESSFGGTILVFTDRARDSAERSAFRRPDEVYEFLEALHAVATELSGGLRCDPRELLIERGFRSKPSATTTMSRYRRFYHMPFEGIEIPLGDHVTLGSRNQNTCLSIHWWHDSERGRFVVGHCGRHLPNSMT